MLTELVIVGLELEPRVLFIMKVTVTVDRLHGGKDSTCQCRRHNRCGFDPWVRKIP